MDGNHLNYNLRIYLHSYSNLRAEDDDEEFEPPENLELNFGWAARRKLFLDSTGKEFDTKFVTFTGRLQIDAETMTTGKLLLNSLGYLQNFPFF